MDLDQQLISTTIIDQATGLEREFKAASGHYVTSVTDKVGVTTFFQDGVILSIIKRDGTGLRTYTHYTDPVTRGADDVDLKERATLPKVTFCLESSGGNLPRYHVVMRNGIIHGIRNEGQTVRAGLYRDPLGTDVHPEH